MQDSRNAIAMGLMMVHDDMRKDLEAERPTGNTTLVTNAKAGLRIKYVWLFSVAFLAVFEYCSWNSFIFMFVIINSLRFWNATE